jgi:hypothetical protein
LDVALPKGQYVGPVAETEGGEWLAAYRAGADGVLDLPLGAAGGSAQPVKVVGPNAFQPVPVRVRRRRRTTLRAWAIARAPICFV